MNFSSWLQFSLCTKTNTSRVLVINGVHVLECRNEPFVVLKPSPISDKMPTDHNLIRDVMNTEFCAFLTRGNQQFGIELGYFRLRLKPNEKKFCSEVFKLEFQMDKKCYHFVHGAEVQRTFNFQPSFSSQEPLLYLETLKKSKECVPCMYLRIFTDF